MTLKQILKKPLKVSIETIIIITSIVIIIGAVEITERRREILFEKIREYKSHIKPEMIISITFDKLREGGDNYIGNPINDWKLKELAFALANANYGSPSRPEIYGSLTVNMNTTGTKIYPGLELYLTSEGLYFDLKIMRNNIMVAGLSFSGEDLNEWANNVGIANTEHWVIAAGSVFKHTPKSIKWLEQW